MRRVRTDYPEHACLICKTPITTKTYCMAHLGLIVGVIGIAQPRGIHGTDVQNERTLKGGGYRHESVNALR